jgi:hypothetical protein
MSEVPCIDSQLVIPAEHTAAAKRDECAVAAQAVV